MRFLIVACLAVTASAAPQANFGKKPEVNERLGLLANDLGLNPTAETSQSAALTAETSAGASGQLPSGRVPGGEEIGEPAGESQCRCVPQDEQCDDPFAGEDLVGLGLIDPRKKPLNSINTRIVNRPGSGSSAPQLNSCPVGQKTCCYDASIDLTVFGRTCVNPQTAAQAVPWTQGCQETQAPRGGKQCGTRSYAGPVNGLSHGQASPGEFPWTCILLNQNNDFVGTCAVITDDFSNNNNAPTRKVITAAHKLKNIATNDLLKVRVGEWDASGFNAPEQQAHEEYTVVRILKHPGMSTTRLSDNLAILYVDRDININHPYVNTACMPSCDNQFDYLFSNGTGVRCHVAGWGKDEIDGSFQFIPKKVDLSLMPAGQCEAKLKVALNAQQPGTGDRFQIHPSEICAGGEVGKDACTGDGGSPLVCQAQSGRWTVVGLVSWGIGCASDVPGVYARMSHFTQWINEN